MQATGKKSILFLLVNFFSLFLASIIIFLTKNSKNEYFMQISVKVNIYDINFIHFFMCSVVSSTRAPIGPLGWTYGAESPPENKPVKNFKVTIITQNKKKQNFYSVFAFFIYDIFFFITNNYFSYVSLSSFNVGKISK